MIHPMPDGRWIEPTRRRWYAVGTMVGRHRRVLALSVVLATAGVAAAQPDPTVNPYSDPAAPAPAPAPADPAASDDVVVGGALVARAQQLLDAGFPEDAKQLAEEAMIRVPAGDVAAQAKAIVDAANRQLGIEPTPPTPIAPPTPVEHPPVPVKDTGPAVEATDPVVSGKRWMAVHGALMGGALGVGLGLALDYDDNTGEEGPGPIIGTAGGIGIGYFAGRWAAGRYHLDAAQAGTIGSASLTGAAVGGLIADIADVGGTTPRDVGIGVAIGTVVGAGGGVLVARGDRFSAGDAALIESFAFYGLVGGLSVGAVMQPAKDEAYSLNSVLGGAGGWIAGALLAPNIDATPRKVSRMVMGALLCGGAPWLIYAGIKDDSTTSDERAIGLISSAGIVAGAYLGYRWSRGLPHESGSVKPSTDDGTVPMPALLRRDSRGAWTVGPALPRAAKVGGQRAWLVDVVGGNF